MNGVGDLQLSPIGWLNRVDGFQNRIVEEVDAHQGQVRRGVGRLFDQPDHMAVLVKLGHPKSARVGHLGEKNLGVGSVFVEVPDDVCHSVFDQIVTQVHQAVVTVHERQCQLEGVCQAVGTVLENEVRIYPEAGAIAHSLSHLGAGLGGNDDRHFVNARRGEVVQAVEQNGLIGDRHELFRHRIRDGPQATAGSSSENNTLHELAFNGRHQSWFSRYQSMVSSRRSPMLDCGFQPKARTLDESSAYRRS